jgi:hypothetical protein
VAAALAVSASTHAVVDRRWLVRRLIALKRCHGWKEAPYLLDQSIHIGVLLVSSVVAAAVDSAGGLAGVLALSAGLVAAALEYERRMVRRLVFPQQRTGNTAAPEQSHNLGAGS